MISSNWRHHFTVYESASLFNFGAYVIDKTDSSEFSRAFEISCWLLSNQKRYKFAIIDDTDDHLTNFFPENFVKVNPKHLYTTENRKRTIEILESS